MVISFIKKYYKHILFFLLLVAGIYSLKIPFDRDEGSYAYVGWLWLSGKGIPYLSVFDQKTPFPYLLYGIGSLLTPHAFIGVRIIAVIYKIAILGLVYKIAKLFSSTSIALCVVLISAWYILSIQLEGDAFNTEYVMILPLLFFLYLIIQLSQQKMRNVKVAILCGIAGALAIVGKTTALYPIVLLLIWYISKKRNVLEVLIIFFSAVFVVGSVVLYFYVQHAYPYLIQDIIIYNRAYVLEGLKPENIIVRGGYPGIIGYISWLRLLPDTLVLLFFLALISYSITYSKKNKSWWIFLLFTGGLWIGAKTGGSREFPHYYIPVAVGLSFCLIPLFSLLKVRKQEILISAITILLVLQSLLPQTVIYAKGVHNIQYVQFGSQENWFSDAVLVGNWIRQNTSKNSTLLVWANEPEIYYYSGKVATTQYSNLYGFYYLPEERKKWYNSLIINKPSYIITYVDDPASFAELQEYLKKAKTFKETKRVGKYIIYKNISV